MKELMTAIKAHLQIDESLCYIRDADIYITEDDAQIPPGCGFPAIEIKDGLIKNEQQLSKQYIQYAQVRLTVFQRIIQPEESIMGSHGVLAIAQDVIASLIDQKLGFTTGNGHILNAFPVGEEPSQTFSSESGGMKIQSKTVVFEYKRHKTW
ncbi:MAG: hypothetical protein AB1611_03195 [bacterium]